MVRKMKLEGSPSVALDLVEQNLGCRRVALLCRRRGDVTPGTRRLLRNFALPHSAWVAAVQVWFPARSPRQSGRWA